MESHAGHRVTIDLRGTEERLHAFATARHLTIAASVRRAIDAMLTSEGVNDSDLQLVAEPLVDGPVVKVTLRLPTVQARLIAMRACKADVSQGEYVAGLVDGTPPAPLMPARGEVVAALARSTSVLSALDVDLKVVARLMRSGAATDSEQHRANIEMLTDVLRNHVALTSRFVASRDATRVRSEGRARVRASRTCRVSLGDGAARAPGQSACPPERACRVDDR
jgi:hypothetical protein